LIGKYIVRRFLLVCFGCFVIGLWVERRGSGEVMMEEGDGEGRMKVGREWFVDGKMDIKWIEYQV